MACYFWTNGLLFICWILEFWITLAVLTFFWTKPLLTRKPLGLINLDTGGSGSLNSVFIFLIAGYSVLTGFLFLFVGCWSWVETLSIYPPKKSFASCISHAKLAVWKVLRFFSNDFCEAGSLSPFLLAAGEIFLLAAGEILYFLLSFGLNSFWSWNCYWTTSTSFLT